MLYVVEDDQQDFGTMVQHIMLTLNQQFLMLKWPRNGKKMFKVSKKWFKVSPKPAKKKKKKGLIKSG